MKKKLLAGLATGLFLVGMVGVASATIIGINDFDSPTIIDFNDAPGGLLGSYYSGLTFVNMYGGYSFDTGTGEGSSLTATNFDVSQEAPFLDGEIYWDSIITRVGFNITTNDPDDTTITASLISDGSIVGNHTFDTGGGGSTGVFVGIEFLSGFDSIVIDSANITNGAFAIDNLRFEYAAPVPEPTTMLLFGTGLAGLAGSRVRRKKK